MRASAWRNVRTKYASIDWIQIKESELKMEWFHEKGYKGKVMLHSALTKIHSVSSILRS